MLKRIGLMAPVFFRLILLICLALALSGLVSPVWGLTTLIVGLFAELIIHLNYIVRLAQWLEDPVLDNIPVVRSALWTEIFSRVENSRKALEKNTKRLSEREARYRKTLDTLPEGILLVKTDWTLSWSNQNASKIFGISEEKDAGRHLFAFVHDQAMLDYLKAGVFATPHIWRQQDSGLVYELSVVAVDQKYDLVIVRDITERDRLDKTRRDFVANVSHELRTPLTVVMGFLDMAIQGLDGKRQTTSTKIAMETEHLRLMRDQTARMQRIVNDLLTLSRLEIGNEEKAPEVFSLSDMVSSVTKEMCVMSQGKHTVTCDTEPLTVEGFGDEIRSAVVNLMTNALRYTPEGGTVNVSCRAEDDGSIEVTVKDNGIGIDPKHIPRLTERFYRVDKSRSRDTGGTGLGLAIVKHVLLHHNAHMNVQSTPGAGATFTLVFPASMRRGDAYKASDTI